SGFLIRYDRYDRYDRYVRSEEWIADEATVDRPRPYGSTRRRAGPAVRLRDRHHRDGDVEPRRSGGRWPDRRGDRLLDGRRRAGELPDPRPSRNERRHRHDGVATP